MRRFLFFPAILFAVGASQAAVPKIQEKYECRGQADGKEYMMSLAIQAKGQNYFLNWGGGSVVGIGLRLDNHLAVSFVHLQSRSLGAAIYEVAEGKLEGRWVSGDGAVYRETCSVGLRA